MRMRHICFNIYIFSNCTSFLRNDSWGTQRMLRLRLRYTFFAQYNHAPLMRVSDCVHVYKPVL